MARCRLDRRASRVAPREGARIEITAGAGGAETGLVAPREGAWIEISASAERSYVPRSRPVRARGLKL